MTRGGKMSIIKIRSQPMEIDIQSELENFNWTRPRWTSDKLIACSPFRHDGNPSFFVSLEHGGWSDSGAYDSEWSSGNFAKLLAFLRNETYEEAEEYLVYKYGKTNGCGLTLVIPKLALPQRKLYLPDTFMSRYSASNESDYLTRRGITERVQRFMTAGYDSESRTVVIPWFDTNGKLANVKYRKTRGKVFYYEKGAVPIRNLIYGLNNVYRMRATTAVVTEAEIDAMSVMSSGAKLLGIALGGANFTDYQRDLIVRSPIRRLVILADNDKAGGKLRDQVVEKLRGRCELAVADINTYKDANEVLTKEGPECLREIINGAKAVRALRIF
jgi:5S rRNA maturation endonuclease (ribonuclease M5)